MRGLLIAVCCVVFSGLALAQDDELVADEVTVTSQVDAFGLEKPFATGTLLNQSESAYRNINLFAEVYDAGDNLIGEGFGFLVNACGGALLNDFALQPATQETFSVPLDIFEEGEIARVEIIPEGQATKPAPQAEGDLPASIIQVTDREVVEVEWIDGQSLRYSPGCWRDVFTNREWYEYSLTDGESQAVEHPRAADISDTTLQLTELTDPALFNRSFFSFAPGQRRAVYQTALNTLVTTEPDGSFRRVLYDTLYNISLQGINWNKSSGTLLAYYHGGYGDDVLYLVAHADGRQFSQHPYASLPSFTVPGFSPNGRGVVITTTVDDVTGYYLKQTDNDFTIFMFEAEPPGNNWPAPFYEITPEGSRWIYIVRPVEGEARLQCFNPDSQQLHDYTALPLDLATDERGWTWLSPDNATLALGANGASGGLWLVDLTAFPACD